MNYIHIKSYFMAKNTFVAEITFKPIHLNAPFLYLLKTSETDMVLPYFLNRQYQAGWNIPTKIKSNINACFTLY